MNYKSGMLKRVQNDFGSRSKKALIPRKGRIRLFLLISAALVAFKLYLLYAGKADAVNAEARKIQKKSAAKTGKLLPEKKQESPAQFASNQKLHGGRLSRQEVRSFLSRTLPDFDKGIDTLQSKRTKVAVHSTIDTNLQKFGHRLFRRYHPRYGALVAVHPVSGKILSLISYTHDSMPSLGNDLYLKNMYPAASIFKTIAAAAFIEHRGYKPETMLRQAGRNHTLYHFQLERELNQFREISLQDAFAYSINPVFGRTAIHFLGEDPLQEYAGRFGFEEPVPFDLPVDTSRVLKCDSAFNIAELASGFNQRTRLTPVLGALIGAAISEDGVMPVPYAIDSLVSIANGKSIYTAKAAVWKKSINDVTALHLRRLMISVARYGTARSAFRYMKRSFRFENVEYGGKTGSVDKDELGKTDWFVGFARHKTDARQRIAVGVVTVHNENWTVHSSVLGAEIMRRYIRSIQIADKKRQKLAEAASDSALSDG
ncbi:MAG: hypothetical protein GF398_15335 [Chitinivibrionales bacterium]|nr:hypothetical protein [Chitinivibrionales bacterium]